MYCIANGSSVCLKRRLPKSPTFRIVVTLLCAHYLGCITSIIILNIREVDFRIALLKCSSTCLKWSRGIAVISTFPAYVPSYVRPAPFGTNGATFERRNVIAQTIYILVFRKHVTVHPDLLRQGRSTELYNLLNFTKLLFLSIQAKSET